MDEDAVAWWLLQWLAQNLTPELVVGIVAVVVLAVAVGAVLAAVTFLRFRRHPKLQRAILRLRAEHMSSGLEAEIIDMRLHLREAMADARHAVESSREAGALAGDLPDILDRLEQAAARLDGHLRLLERSEEGRAAYRSVSAAERQVADVVTAARDIRQAAIAALNVASAGEVQGLTRAVEREVAWVQSAVGAMDELLGPAPRRILRGPSRASGRDRVERPRR